MLNRQISQNHSNESKFNGIILIQKTKPKTMITPEKSQPAKLSRDADYEAILKQWISLKQQTYEIEEQLIIKTLSKFPTCGAYIVNKDELIALMVFQLKEDDQVLFSASEVVKGKRNKSPDLAELSKKRTKILQTLRRLWISLGKATYGDDMFNEAYDKLVARQSKKTTSELNDVKTKVADESTEVFVANDSTSDAVSVADDSTAVSVANRSTVMSDADDSTIFEGVIVQNLHQINLDEENGDEESENEDEESENEEFREEGKIEHKQEGGRLNVIRARKHNQNDVVHTPNSLVKHHLFFIRDFYVRGDKILDPFKGKGAYFNIYDKYFPQTSSTYYWCEITEGVDFFKFSTPVDIIVSNPPFSQLDKVLEHSITLNPRVISYVMGVINLTNTRVEMMRGNGYGLHSMYVFKVKDWFSSTVIAIFLRNYVEKSEVIFLNRTYSHSDEDV